MDITTLYLYLSEGESSVEDDVNMLVKKKILTMNEIEGDDTLLVCISRDYYDQPYDGPALMIRDQLSNVFCPEWRMNSVRYEPFRNFSKKSLPRPSLKVIVKNKNIYENLDYFMHLKGFNDVEKLYINVKNSSFEPVESRISDYAYLGKMTVDLLKRAGYDRDENGSVNALWVFQPANHWLGRLLDLRGITPTRLPHLIEYPPYVYTTKQDLINTLKNPTVIEGPYIGEDIRGIFCHSYESRKLVLEESELMLENLGF